MTFWTSMISWTMLLLGSVTSSAEEPPKFPFTLEQKESILLLALSSIPVDALFHLSWHVADSLCYTAVHFFDNFIGDFTNESAL